MADGSKIVRVLEIDKYTISRVGGIFIRCILRFIVRPTRSSTLRRKKGGEAQRTKNVDEEILTKVSSKAKRLASDMFNIVKVLFSFYSTSTKLMLSKNQQHFHKVDRDI